MRVRYFCGECDDFTGGLNPCPECGSPCAAYGPPMTGAELLDTLGSLLGRDLKAEDSEPPTGAKPATAVAQGASGPQHSDGEDL